MEGEFIVSSWILTCAANSDFNIFSNVAYPYPYQVHCVLFPALRFARGLALHVLLLDDHHAINECVLFAVM